MNTPAIYQAIRFMKEPKEMAWLSFPDSDYSEGMCDLLRISADQEKLIDFAKTNELDPEELSSSLFNFIEKAVLSDKNCDEKILGANKFSTSQTLQFHHQLLSKIYNPENSKRPNAEHFSCLINSAYQNLKNKELDKDGICFSENRIDCNKLKKQTPVKLESEASITKSAFALISVVTICSLVAMTGKFHGSHEPEIISSNIESKNVVQKLETDNEQITKISNIKAVTNDAVESPSITATNNSLQALLKDLESAYEDGNVKLIKPLLANTPTLTSQTEEELNDKLETIFEITSERKMVLFDFNWTSESGLLKGNGKFISRYKLSGEDKWLTREGTAVVSAKKEKNKLILTQFILENQDL